MGFSQLAKKIARFGGYDLVRLTRNNKNDEFSEFMDIYTLCKNYSMTSIERMYSLYKSVEYIVKNNIPGDFVECGVWRGGSSMVIAMALIHFNATNRNIYLFDTFEGMTDPTDKDIDKYGATAQKQFHLLKKKGVDCGKWCYASLDDVRKNMEGTGYPADNIRYVKGRVEETLPAFIPAGDISLLRLDTDWYESTKHELINLYPKLVVGGVLIIDDYGYWLGAKLAVDEYFSANKFILLNRIDCTGRVGIKI